jgi:hypothetical protein
MAGPPNREPLLAGRNRSSVKSRFVDEDGITCYDYSVNHYPMGYAFGIKNHKVVYILMSAGE